jgi:poly-gamma-glutamate synthase PgsB/CapB
MDPFEAYLVTSFCILFFFLSLGTIEYFVLVKRRTKVPLRIHVNGIRGKSSTVRLIAGALRESGLRVVAKTTGTAPRIIYPDGEEKDIFRIEKPNIIEQLLVFREAEREGADAVVVECMALWPHFQKFSEEKIIRSNIGVITNVRADHLDVMGPTIQDVAEALGSTIPRNGVLVTAEKNLHPYFVGEGNKKKTAVIFADEEKVLDSMMEPFGYIEHKENVAIALEVSRHLQIPDETALRGMYKAKPDPGVLKTFIFFEEEKQYQFINAFAANDGHSTLKIWEKLSTQFSAYEKKFLLLYTRKDRAQRSVDIIPFLVDLPIFAFLLIGSGTLLARKCLFKKGVEQEKIFDLGEQAPVKIFAEIKALAGARNVIFGAGNIVGLGMDMVNFFEVKSGTP